MSVGELTMFGKAYDTVGSTNKNLILQTRGDLKIRWGNKFIDLIKNGKINVNVDLLKQVDNKDNINKNGIYLIQNEENQEVWLYIDGTLINLVGEVSNTYVTYLKNQDVDAEGKFTALSNIGLYYNTLDDAKAAKLTSGIIYILDQNKFYYIDNNEYKEYKPTSILEVPNPLIIDKLSLNGSDQEITAKSSLKFNIANSKYFSLNNSNIEFYKNVVLSNPIYSNNYETNKLGFAIYVDNTDYIGEFDIIKVRKAIIYEDIEDITYDDLVGKIKNSELHPDRKYRIIDFYNEWDVYNYDLSNEQKQVPEDYKDLYEDPSNVQFYFPVTVTAKTKNSLKKEGYFCDNKDWIIEYDVDFNYLIKEVAVLIDGSRIVVSEDLSDDDKLKLATIDIDYYETYYSKGRITKLTDEFGNSANYDFKHKLFKSSLSTDDRKDWYYTFNRAKSDEEIKVKSLKWEYIHNNWDASLDGNIKNNIFNLPEPEIVDYKSKSNGDIIKKIKQLEDYVIFEISPGIVIPHDNNIGLFKGQYYIKKDFYKNTVKGFIYNTKGDLELIYIEFYFYKNTCNNIYMHGDQETPSETEESSGDKKTIFKKNIKWTDNKINDIVNCNFKNDFIYNKFYDEFLEKYFSLTNCNIEENIQYSIFLGDVKNVKFVCTSLKNSGFKNIVDSSTFNSISGEIDNTDENNIKYTVILNEIINTTFKKEIKKLDAFNSSIKDCTFNGIIEDANIKGILIDCQFEKLSGKENKAIEIGKLQKKEGENEKALSIEKMIIQSDINPKSANYIQKENAPNEYKLYKPLKVNTEGIPRLAENARKICYIKIIKGKTEAEDKKVFYIELSTEDSNPKGIILMFYPGRLQEGQKLEDVIPKGYAICDGNNGTPNLVGRFIKGTATPAEVKEYNNTDLEQGTNGTYNSIKIKENNLPPHTHTFNVTNNLSIQDHTYTGVEGSNQIEYASGSEPLDILTTNSKRLSHNIQGNITITQNSTNTFTNDVINVEPNYYALIFIMKL